MKFRAAPGKLAPLQLAAPDIEAWLLAKDPMAIGAFNELAPEEYARAFTAAQTAGTDIAETLYEALLEVVSSGGELADFSALVRPTLRQKGWLGGDARAIASRVELIYSTNMFQARRSGQWTNYQRNTTLFPYIRAFTVGDERVRHPPKSRNDHRAWDGIILPANHSFWLTYGPGHFCFRCRCDSVQMSRSELMRSREGVTSEADLADRIARIGPPDFAPPAAPIATQLAAMTATDPAKPRMPGLPSVDPVQTEREGRDIWDAVIAAKSRADIGRNLARFGFG